MFTTLTAPAEAPLAAEILRRAASSFSAGKPTLIIVPDQFSFEYEKNLYIALGASSNGIQAAGFNRLCTLIEQEYAVSAGADADDNTRAILMFRAMKRLKSEGGAQYYGKLLDRSYFLGDLLHLADDCAQCAVSPAGLEAAVPSLSGSAQRKTADLAQLLTYFNAELSARGLRDRVHAVQKACDTARAHGVFCGYDVYIDGFRSFSAEELHLLTVIIAQAGSVTVGLVCGETENPSASPFAATIRTASELRDIAAGFSKPCRTTALGAQVYDSPALAQIADGLAGGAAEKAADADGFALYAGADAYEECDFVAADIRQLIREEGASPSEIAVICRNINGYAAALHTAFARHELALFIDDSAAVSQSALMIYVYSLLELLVPAAYRTESILKFIKSPLSFFTSREAADLEEYCAVWNVQGEMWKQPFTAGGGEKPAYLNALRERLIAPAEEFKSACAGASAQDLCAALGVLLNRTSLSERAYAVLKQAADDTDETAQELSACFKQLWSAFVSVVNAISDTLGDEPLTVRQFAELLKAMLAQLKTASPPQKLEAVIAADAEHSRLAGIRYAYVIGVNDGVMPLPPKEDGLFSDRERKMLADADVKLGTSLLRRGENERLTCFLAMTTASRRLTVSFCESDEKGKLSRPSRLISELTGFFRTLPVRRRKDFPAEFFCTCRRAAFDFYAENAGNKLYPPAEIAAVREALCRAGDAAKVEWLDRAAQRHEHTLSETTAHPLFFPGELFASATQTEQFFQCPFSYFCKYGLRIRVPTVMELGALNAGSLIHGVLLALMTLPGEKPPRYNPDFPQFSQEALEAGIRAFFASFTANTLGGDFGKTPRFFFQLKRLETAALDAAQNIQAELRVSKFVPAAFEFGLAPDGGNSILRIALDETTTMNIVGSVDRADVYTAENGKRYLRVVDYKTGGKKLDFAELYNGLNLQMLIYLTALTECENPLKNGGELVPAGMVYMPAGTVQKLADSKTVSPPDASPAQVQKALNFRRNGIILADDEIYQAMDQALSGDFSPKKNKNGTMDKQYHLETENFMKAAARFTRDKLREFGCGLRGGEIAAMPAGKTTLPCTYCDYWTVCGNYNRKDAKKITSADADQLKKTLAGKEDHHDGD
ncbi:MAG: PD-(D/E)XK nuclease family protein [Oscillospiraceae bacterium]